ncbi:MAG: PKD domain-containing protein [Bacteroidales bacterium]|nr:PKD domain-containing protein [Bacteroidales bacterium]
MKKLFFKMLAIGLFLLAMPLRQFGQDVHNHMIELELEAIDNPDKRFCLLSNIANDDHYIYTIDEDNNSVFVFSSKQWPDQQFQDYFNQTKAAINTEFNSYLTAEKETQGNTFIAWKESLPQDLYVLLFKIMLIENPVNRDGNQTCATSDPFCTTDVVTFHVEANPGGYCESGPYYGCLAPYTDRPPFWFHMKIGVAGNFTIRMTNSSSVDIDYCCWGPFSDPITPCPSQLTQAKYIDCGSSGAATETCQIPSSAQVGQYYIMVITKYNQSTATNITFQKVAGSGPGETDCGILPPLIENGGPYCVGDNIQLSGNAQQGATYSWSGPGGWSATGHTVNRPNCTMAMNGTYTCTITLNGQTNSATTEVQVFPKPTANFTANSVCKGESTQFTNSSTTNPANQSISYLWDFGDGQTSNQTSPSHPYAEAGNYTVTLTASCGNGSCTSTKTQNVTVYQTPVASATATNSVVQYGGTTQLHGSGGTGSFTYHWEPANKVVNANIQNPETVGLTETTTFTVTATQPQGGCNSTAQVIVSVQGSNMTASASASPSSICRGETAQLNAIAVGGNANNYSYSWSPSLGLSDPLIANPVASPTATTTYTCNVSDGYTSQQVSTTVTVNQPEYVETTEYICPGDTYNFYGTEYSEVGDYDYNTTTSQGCEKVITLHLRHYPSYENAHTTTEYICPGTSYNFHGHYYSTTGLHSETLHTIHGCDSVVWLDLTVYPANDTTLVDAEICTSQTYNFHGIEYNTDTVVYFDTLDHHGCLKVEKLVLGVGPYQKPPKEQPRICYAHDDSPSYYWDKTQQTYTEDTYDEIILPDPDGGCDVLHRLDLKFHQEFYRTETETVCDQFVWHATPGITYNTTNHNLVKVFHETGGTGFACDSTFVLDLTVNHSTNDTIQVYNQCNQYDWQFGWNNETYGLTEQSNYTKTIDTYLGCDSTVTLKLQLDYTPDFEKVYGNKWVIGGSEFQFSVERYWIELEHPRATHQTTWELHDKDGNPFNKWEILPYGNGDNCYLYIYTFERDTIWLHAHTESTGDCECGSDDKELWIVCGYHSVNETIDPCTVDIFPNPNDGNMTLSFDNMEGETLIKVYNITGTLVDQFTIHNEFGHWAYTYQSGRLTPGVYFFNIANKKGILTKKVIILD